MLVIFVPRISGGVKVSVRQEGEAWMREGRRERIGSVRDCMMVLSVFLSIFSSSESLSSEQAQKKLGVQSRILRRYLFSILSLPK